MDTSLFSKYQATQASAAQAVGTALAPKSGATSNLRTTGGASPFAAKAAATTGGTTGTSTSTTSAANDAATITSSDFLTLLVSELQNQDPTAPTDPTEYISQLVGVNSLEQLIAINSGITALDPPTTTSTGTGTGTGTGGVVQAGSVVPAITAAAEPQAAQQSRRLAGTPPN